MSIEYICVPGTILEIKDTKKKMHGPWSERADPSAEKWQDTDLVN